MRADACILLSFSISIFAVCGGLNVGGLLGRCVSTSASFVSEKIEYADSLNRAVDKRRRTVRYMCDGSRFRSSALRLVKVLGDWLCVCQDFGISEE